MPRELSKVVLPTYVVEPPDILRIEGVHLVPKEPYLLRANDVISVEAEGVLDDPPLQGAFPVEPNGTINLGRYGRVRVLGMTVDQARAAIDNHLRQQFRQPKSWVTLLQTRALQQIGGEHLVGPDGMINLGSYGSVRVVGMTLVQAKWAIESHLSQFLERPEVSVDVFAYNSKVYYVITEGAGLGDTVTKFPITGNETVLDAIANIQGLTQLSSKKIWIARPTPSTCEFQILPVHWRAITATGEAATNYQVLPGDRVFIAENRMVAWDTFIGKFTSPFERMFGFTLLGVNTTSRLSGKILQNSSNNNNGP
ncbi:MAG: polysaccharide biosynthesis/export family protein [Planctomycetales bacterium]|nr:polysaccharide biosynthesis/export family protein [Planctomycetales bacterium]